MCPDKFIRRRFGKGVIVNSHWLTRWLTLAANIGVLIGIVLVLMNPVNRVVYIFTLQQNR